MYPGPLQVGCAWVQGTPQLGMQGSIEPVVGSSPAALSRNSTAELSLPYKPDQTRPSNSLANQFSASLPPPAEQAHQTEPSYFTPGANPNQQAALATAPNTSAETDRLSAAIPAKPNPIGSPPPELSINPAKSESNFFNFSEKQMINMQRSRSYGPLLDRNAAGSHCLSPRVLCAYPPPHVFNLGLRAASVDKKFDPAPAHPPPGSLRKGLFCRRRGSSSTAPSAASPRRPTPRCRSRPLSAPPSHPRQDSTSRPPPYRRPRKPSTVSLTQETISH